MSSRAIANGWPIGAGNPPRIEIKLPPIFVGIPVINPGIGSAGSTFAAIDPLLTNGTVISQLWFLNDSTIGSGPTVTPAAGQSGQLTRRLIAAGDDGSTISVTSLPAIVMAASLGIPPNGVWNDTWTWDDTQIWKDAA